MTFKIKEWSLIEPLTQEHLEQFELAFQPRHDVGRAHHAGALVRSALDAGWFKDPPLKTAGEVGSAAPALIQAVAKLVNAAYATAIDIPENLS